VNTAHFKSSLARMGDTARPLAAASHNGLQPSATTWRRMPWRQWLTKTLVGALPVLATVAGLLMGRPALATSPELAARPAVPIQPGKPGDGRPRAAEPARYADVQERIDRLLAQGKPCPVPYHLAKAQAWLNFSRDQYHERVWQGGIRDTTLEQARTIVELLEAGRMPSMDTPLVSDAQRLRPDLWAMAEKVKQQAEGHLCCAQKETAWCEVQLVWSGHILQNVGGWRATNPHIRQAEDLCREAEQLRCPAPQPAVLPTVKLAPPPPPPVEPSYTRITLSAHALFLHDKATEPDMLPEGRRQIAELVEKLRDVSGVQRIVVSGHADITNDTGDLDYNNRLSLARAQTVAFLLRQGGVKLADEDIRGMGDLEPVVGCTPPKGSDGVRRGSATRAAAKAYHACLQPNRRVEIEIIGQLRPK
jgi:outer membrane protein OmpA-like peptidoglycan-associated protein